MTIRKIFQNSSEISTKFNQLTFYNLRWAILNSITIKVNSISIMNENISISIRLIITVYLMNDKRKLSATNLKL